MEYFAVLCDCDYEENILIKECKYCIKPYNTEVTTLRNLLSSMEHKTLLSERLDLIRQIFEYILTCSDFIASQPGFRKAVSNKLNEFRSNEQCNSLTYLFDKMDVFLVTIQGNSLYKE
jgi:hypothetical protein